MIKEMIEIMKLWWKKGIFANKTEATVFTLLLMFNKAVVILFQDAGLNFKNNNKIVECKYLLKTTT